MKITNRKLLALFICLATSVGCAAFNLDVSVGVSTLYGIYVAGNVSSKFSNNNRGKIDE